MRLEGVIRAWNDERGFGFIVPSHGGPEVFVHIQSMRHAVPRPSTNQAVTYAITMGPNSKPRAKDVALVAPAGKATAGPNPTSSTQANQRAKPAVPSRTPRQAQPQRRRSSNLSSWLALAIGAAVVGSAYVWGQPPRGALWWYSVLSLVTFLAYALDKSAARHGRWRTQENTLHLMALAGGWPGALLAQQVLRHKSSKQPFRAVFWMTMVLNLAAYTYLSSHLAPELLRW